MCNKKEYLVASPSSKTFQTHDEISFIFSNSFILVRVMEDPRSTGPEMGIDLEGILVHHRHHIFTNLHTTYKSTYWDVFGRWKMENLDEPHEDRGKQA